MGRLVRKRGLVTFAILVLVAEVVGRSLTGHVDRLFHVEPMAPPDASYYPLLLVAVKTVGALALAALVARGARAWAAADAGNRLLTALGRGHERRSPRLCRGLSVRIWAASFVATSVVYLVHADADGAQGRWPLLAPWLHTYALPVFAVLAVAISLVWRFASWLYEVEEYAVRTIARVQRLIDDALQATPRLAHSRATDDEAAPRRRFGLSFESRPPPLPA